MKKSLFWSLLAATAIMTGCSNEEILDSQPQALSGEEVPVNFSINMGGDISTYATESAKGGWSNYKVDADMQAAYNHRAIIQVFTQSGDQAKPISEERVVLDEAPQSDEISINNLRLPAGHSYTAVVWVDFVTAGTSTTADRNDNYYDTENLRAVKVLGTSPLALDATPEGRDAYTGFISFTVNADGTYDFDASTNQTSDVAIPITAKRPFGKVRLVLTDWDNKAQWAQYYAGQTKVMNALEMIVGDNMATTYNALTGEPVYTGTEGAFTFTRTWANADFTGAASATINGVNWIEVKNGITQVDGEDHKAVTGVADGLYPVLDFNYFIPINNDDAASYKLGIKTYGADANAADAQALISTRSFASIPVKTNCLTTIWGNFLTAGYNFTVTVNDEFDQFSQTVVKDDATSTDIVHNWGNATARVERDATGKVIEIEVDAEGNYVDFDEEQWAKIIYEINRLGDISDATVLIHASALPATTDFADLLPVGSVEIQLENTALAQATTIANSSSPLKITNEVAQTNAIAVTDATSSVEIAGASNYAAVTVGTSTNATFSATGEIGAVVADAVNVAFNGAATYTSTVNTTGATTFAAGTFNGVVTAQGTSVVINGGTFNDNFNSYVGTTINGGSLDNTKTDGANYDHKLSMLASTATTLYINDNVSFGPIWASDINPKHNLSIYADDESTYNAYNTGNFYVIIRAIN